MVQIGTKTCNAPIINIQLCQDVYPLKLVTSAFFQINYNSHMTQKNHSTFTEKVLLNDKNPWNKLILKLKSESRRILKYFV